MNWNTPPSSIKNDLPTPGRFLGPIREIDTAIWDTTRRRRLERKAWVFAGAYSEKYAIGFAIIDAGLIASAFTYIYHRETNTLTERKITCPLGFRSDYNPSLRSTWGLTGGSESFSWDWDDEQQIYHAQYRNKDDLIQLQMKENDLSISAINRTPKRPFQYTEKNIGLKTLVKAELNGEKLEFTTLDGVLDFSIGYPPRYAQWQWTSLSGIIQNESGDRLGTFGLNGVAQYFNGLENACWYTLEDTEDSSVSKGSLAPQRLALPQVIFDYQSHDILKPWQIQVIDSSIRIKFTPDGLRQEHLELGLFASKFKQLFGRFEGEFTLDHTRYRVVGYGVGEEHEVKW